MNLVSTESYEVQAAQAGMDDAQRSYSFDPTLAQDFQRLGELGKRFRESLTIDGHPAGTAHSIGAIGNITLAYLLGYAFKAGQMNRE